MIRLPLLHLPRGLRPRMIFLLMACILVAGAGFEALLVTVTRQSEWQELESRARSLGRLLAERSVTPVVVGDVAEVDRQVRRAIAEPDIVGAAVRTASGSTMALRSRQGGLWDDLGAFSPPADRRSVQVTRRRIASGDALEIIAPILHSRPHGGSLGEADQLYGFSEAAPREPAGPHLGYVQLVVSAGRCEAVVQNAARLGFLLWLLSSLLAMVGISLYVGFVIRPLREARDLAQAIASGQLDRRLPVRSGDELGDLAGSMNSMAGSLQKAQARAEQEAEALRNASAAMLSIARGARSAQDPRSVFQMVAHEVAAVTHARAVALAVPTPQGGAPVFEHFSPPAPWGGLERGRPLPEQALTRLRGLGDGAMRLSPATDSECPLCAALAAEDFRAALLVSLLLPGSGTPAVLLVASADADAFPAAERDVVIALTSHLSSALHAQRLEARLEEAFEELQRTHDYLVHSEMLRVVGEMAAGVAHDFNNLLGAILGRAQLLKRRLENGELSSEELLTSLAVIERAAEDGRETGRRLRQFGPTTHNASAKPVDLHAIVRDAVEFTRPRWLNEAQAEGLTIEVRVESRPGAWVAGRASELREVFTNLILNAIDALPEGGTILIAVDASGERVEVSVADDGVGMDEETSRRLFQPFFTTKGERGTGLGLAVVYGIVQAHGGTIAVDTRLGSGTLMHLSFAHAQAPEERPETSRLDGQLPVLDVLVVDDEAPVREVLRDITAALGQGVTECASGAEALKAFQPGLHSLVLTDLGMPGMTGWELARRLRTMDPDVTIVFVTGWGEDVDHRAAGDAGASLVLAKPFNLEDVERAVRLAGQRLSERMAA